MIHDHPAPPRDRVLILALALLTRGLTGWIFFGSVDLTNAILNSGRLFSGMPLSEIPVPYFPGIYQLCIWTSAVLASNTALPLAFCYKLFPILFDAAVAVLVYDYLMPARRRAMAAGVLYALAVVKPVVCGPAKAGPHTSGLLGPFGHGLHDPIPSAAVSPSLEQGDAIPDTRGATV